MGLHAFLESIEASLDAIRMMHDLGAFPLTPDRVAALRDAESILLDLEGIEG